jgi:Large polyvalent protein associated domain 22
VDVNYDDIAKDVFANDAAPINPDLEGMTRLEQPAQIAKVENPYDAIANEMADEEKQSVSHSLYVAEKQQPDRRAEVIKLAQQHKMPVDLIDRNYDTFKAKSKPVDPDFIIKNTPGLGRFLTDSDNATLAKDDLDNLQKVEKSVGSLSKPSKGFFSDLGQAGSTGFNNLGAASHLLGAAFGLTNIEDAAEKVAEYNKKAQELGANKPDYAKEFSDVMAKEGADFGKAADRFIGSYDELRRGNISKALKDASVGGVQSVGELAEMIVAAGKHPKGLGYATVENLANSLPSLAAGGGGALVGGPVGFLAGSFGGEYATEVGAWINQALQERGVDMTDPQAIIKAYKDPKFVSDIRAEAERKGVGTAGTSFLFNLFGGVLTKGATGTLSKVARKTGDIAIQSVGEGASEAAGQMAAKKSVQGIDWADVAQEGIISLGHSMGETAMSPIAQGASKLAESRRKELAVDPVEAATQMSEQLLKANRAQQDAKTLDDIGKIISESKLAQRLPEKIKELVANIGEVGEPQAVYFQPDEFDSYWNSKGKSPAQAAEQMVGDGGVSYQEAKETGQPIKVPIENYIETATQSQEDYNGLLEIARTDTDAMSLNESREAIKAAPATMEELAKEAANQQPEKDSSLEIKENVLNQLKEIGYSQTDANMVATLNQSVFKRFAEASKVDAKVLFDKYGLQIKRGDTAVSGEQVLNQKIEETDRWKPPTDNELVSEFKGDGESFFNNEYGQQDYNGKITADDYINLVRTLGQVRRLDVEELKKHDPHNEESVANGEAYKPSWESITKGMDNGDKISMPVFLEHKNGKLSMVSGRHRIGAAIQKGLPVDAIIVPYGVRPGATVLNQSAVKPNQLGFTSKLEQTIQDKMGGAQDVTSLRAMLKDIKPEEMKWSGLDEFLKGKTKVTKAEVQDFLRANQLEIKEITHGFIPAGFQTEQITVGDFKKEQPEWGASYAERMGVSDSEPIWVVRKDGKIDGVEKTKELVESLYRYSGMDGSTSETKFSKYTLPGGENYREVLLTLPPTKVNETPAQAAKRLFGKDSFYDLTAAQQKQITKEQSLQEPIDTYSSSHYDEANILAHVRLNDRTDSDGKKVLFVEEIQSDWHQAGRKYGYRGQAEESYFNIYRDGKRFGEFKTEAAAKDQIAQIKILEQNGELDVAKNYEIKFESRDAALASAVPDAPFKKTWHEFALKRILRMAAEGGYDRVAWTTGEQQAERYDLSKKFRRVSYNPETSSLKAYDMSGSMVMDQFTQKDALDDYIGKDLANKLLESPQERGTHQLVGDGLKVPKKGMIDFYDKIISQSADKLVKKFGSKVGSGEIDAGMSSSKATYIGPQLSVSQIRSLSDKQDARTQRALDMFADAIERGEMMADAAINLSPYAAEVMGGKLEIGRNKTKVHSLDITPELKTAAINEGFTLFQENRGQINLGDRSNVLISLFKTADPSTLLHEFGHFYLEVMGDIVGSESAAQSMKDDYATLLKWLGVESRDQITREHHEKLAKGFETYLMEGKAPSLELRKAFARFKVWLVSVYRQLSNTGVEINPEIRGVFDRLVATEAEINKAESEAGDLGLFTDPASIGMNDKTAARYLEMREEARLASEDKVRAELMLYAKKAETAFYKQKKKELTDKYTAEVSSMPIYKVIDKLKDNGKDGPPVKISKSYLKDQYDEKLISSLPTGITSSEGMHPDIVADMYGFESGDAMLTQMANLPSKKQFIDTLVNQELERSVPDPMFDGTISDQAVEAVHNEKREALLRFELEQMAKTDMPAFKDMTKRLIKRLPLAKASRDSAKAIVEKTNVRDLRPDKFVLAERKQSGIAAKAWAAGDIEAAFEAKKKELLNFYLFQEATLAKKDVEKSVKNFKKIARADEDVAKTRDVDMVNAARAVLSQYGLDTKGKSAAEHLAKIQQYDPYAYETIKALTDNVSQNAAPYKGISYSQFVDMRDAVMAIWDLAKTSKEIEVDGKKMSRDEAMNELASRIDELAPNAEKPGYKKALSKWDKVNMKMLQFKAAMTRVEHWIEATDKDFGGPFRKYIFNPVMEGISKYRARKFEVITKYKEHVKKYEDIFTKQPIKAEALGYEFKDMAHLMGAILHSGNDSNLSKLLRGYGWGSRNDDGSLNRQRWDDQINKFYRDGIITKRHMDFIQGVWDLFEEIKPELQTAHKEMQGYFFNEVTANPINTPFGEYRGGYAPAKADKLIVEDAQIRSEVEAAETMNPSFNFPTSGKGATMSRVEAYAAPLTLDMNLVGSHIDWAMRFAHIEPRVKEVNRIMLNKKFREKLAQLDSRAAQDMFVPWLQRIAQQSAVRTSTDSTGKVMDAVAGYIRSSVAMQVMTANVTNTLQQFTGVIVAASKVKPRFLRNSLVTYVGSPAQTSKFITESSKWMEQNQKNNVYEAQKAIDEVLLNPSTFENMKNFSKKHQYFLQTAAQNSVNNVVWLGAYNQAIEGKETHDKAVKMADSAVRLTQGSAAVEDISEFETGTQTARLFKQFVGYFNMLANLNGSELVKISRSVGLKKGAGKAFYIYLTAFALPAIMSELIVKAMVGKFDEDDDDEYLDDALSIFFGSQFRTMAAMTPYVGTYVQTSYNQFNKQRYDDRLSLSPAISMIESTTSAPKSVYEAMSGKANSEKKAIRDVLLLMGVATGLPLAPLSKPIGYSLDVRSGKAEPSGPIDFTRGLITGRPGSK